jgi:UDP-N-acetylmuramyl pentapeptide synthase
VRTVLDTAHWKSRIFDGLTGASVAIIGEHLQCFEYIREKARKHAKRVIVFGTSSEAEVQILNIEGDESGSRVVLRTPEQQVSLYVPVPSLGMVHNAVASLCALYAMGRDLTAGANSLQNIELEEGRLRRAEVALSGHSVSVIDDSWNATISSMLNAFSVLAQTKAGDGGRKVAVLGRIVHLGDQSQALHESLAEPLMASGVDLVVTHGEEMQHLRVMLPEAVLGPHFSAATELIRYLEKSTRQSDLILIKGSRRDSDFGSIAKLLNEIAKEKSSYA